MPWVRANRDVCKRPPFVDVDSEHPDAKCRVLGVSTSGDYVGLSRGPSWCEKLSIWPSGTGALTASSITLTRGASTLLSSLGGGDANTAGGDASTVSGGWDNTATYFRSTVGGGEGNTASAPYATIAGGRNNTITGTAGASAIGGGRENAITDSANFAAIPGGRSNRAEGAYSFAAGRRAQALYDGDFVWADSTDADFAATGPDQFMVRATGGVSSTTGGAGFEIDGNNLYVQGDLQVVGNYIQFPTITGSDPPAADCDEASEAGRIVVRTDTATLYICVGTSGWVSK